MEDKEKIESRLALIQNASKDEIKQLYRETRRSGRNSHSRGGGLGFLEIAKKVEKFEYEFTELSTDKLYFKFCTTL